MLPEPARDVILLPIWASPMPSIRIAFGFASTSRISRSRTSTPMPSRSMTAARPIGTSEKRSMRKRAT